MAVDTTNRYPTTHRPGRTIDPPLKEAATVLKRHHAIVREVAAVAAVAAVTAVAVLVVVVMDDPCNNIVGIGRSR